MEEKIFSWLKDRVAENGSAIVSESSLKAFAHSLSSRITEEENLDEALAPYLTFFKESIAGDLSAALEKGNGSTGGDDKNKYPELSGLLKPLVEKVTELSNRLDKADLQSQKQNVIKDIKNIMKEKGADNDALIDIALRFAELDYSRPASDLAETCRKIYDTKYTELYGEDGFAPGGGDTGGPKNSSSFKERIDAIKNEINRERGIEPPKQ